MAMLVPGILNPADDAIRGLHPHQLTSEHRWLNGPGFLKQGDEWPMRKEFTQAPDDPDRQRSASPNGLLQDEFCRGARNKIHECLDRLEERKFTKNVAKC